MGERMHSQTPKILHKILGKEIILFAVDFAREINSQEIIVVADQNIDKVKKIIGGGIKYVLQSMPLGTGDAALKGVSKAKFNNILIVNGDIPMLNPATIKAMITFHNKKKAALTFLSCKVRNPDGYGRVVRKSSGDLCGIVEHTDASAQQRKIIEINAGVYFGDRRAIVVALHSVDQHNQQAEFYLTDIVGVFLKTGKKVFAHKINDEDQIMGINTKYDLACVREKVKQKWYKELMEQGVFIEDPASTTIDLTVKCSRYVHIKPNVILEGETTIKERTVIDPFTFIRNGKRIKSRENV